MKVEYAFLAEAAKVAEDGTFDVLTGGITAISVTSLPRVQLSLALVTMITYTAADHKQAEESNTQPEIRVNFTGPLGGLIAETRRELKLTKPERPDGEKNIKLIVQIGPCVFPVLGEYHFKLWAGDQELEDFVFSVVQSQEGK